ncbi:hypothetical protein GCM10009738_02890 [Kitasatospora viridis]
MRVLELPDGRLAVYDERAEQGHVLSPLCAVVYRLADGTLPLAGLTAAAARVRPEADTASVELALAALDAAGLVEAPPDGA